MYGSRNTSAGDSPPFSRSADSSWRTSASGFLDSAVRSNSMLSIFWRSSRVLHRSTRHISA